MAKTIPSAKIVLGEVSPHMRDMLYGVFVTKHTEGYVPAILIVPEPGFDVNALAGLLRDAIGDDMGK